MQYRLAAKAAIFLMVLACLTAPVAAQVTSVTVVEKAGVTTANYPMTVSMIFKQGDVASNVTAVVGGNNLTTQTDVKVRWPDNSVKHALVSFVIPSMPANGSVTVSFNSGGTNANSSYTSKAQLLATDFDARMTITPAGGTATTITARNLLNGIANPEYWIQGQICSEFLIRDFSQNISNQLNVQYYVRYYPGWSGFRVDAVVENCWTEYRGNLTYDFNLLLGNSNPQSVFAKTAFTHNINARWHKVFWQGTTPPAVEVRYNLPYLISTKLLPPYDTSLVVPESTISSAYSGWQGSAHDIMQNGIITVYFPTTGGRQEVGLYPTWAARYLLSMDNRMKEITLNCGDLSGSIPIHLREGNAAKSAKNHVMTIDDRPTVWASWWDYTYQDAADKLPAPVGPTTTEWTVDNSHQAAFACIPYLVTGDFYYLEEMYFWGAWDLADSNHAYRSDAQGLINDQTRGDAWAIRNISDAASLAPDTQTLEKNYFTNKTNNNINNWINRYITTGNYPSIHYWQDQSNIGADGGRPDGDLVTTCRYYTSTWMDDFVLTVLTHMKDVGWNTSSLVDWLGVSIINRFHNPDYNWYRGAPYHIPTAYNDGNNNGIRYATWLDVNNAFAVQPGPTDFPNPDYADNYTFIARCALGGVTHLTNGQATWNWIDSHLYTKSSLNDNPTWGILPRGAVPPSDTTAPAAVANLATSSPTSSQLTLTWTAPGDDGSSGTATSYDIRYSTSTINDTNWGSATLISGEPTPTAAGTNQSMTVGGLSASTTYYFAMKTSDEVPNVSALSNVASGTTSAGTLPTVQFDLSSSSGSESVTSVNLAVSLSASSSQTVTVNYAVSGGTATSGTDYTISGTQLTFNPGVTSQNVPITVVNDTAVESNETIIVTLSSPTNATLGSRAAHTYTINDNDTVGYPAVQFSTTTSSGSESVTPANVTVTLSASSSQVVTVNYAVTGGTATQGTDYTLPPSGSQVIALKRDAGLLQGGAIDSRFTSLSAANVVTTTVKDAIIAGGGNGAFMNYGTTNLVSGYWGGPSCVFGWNLSTYAGATVNKAQVRIHCTMGNSNIWYAGIKTHDWAEGNKNGDYPGVAPAAAGVCWNHPNGTYATNSGPLGWGAASSTAFDETADTGDVYSHVDFTSVPGGDAFVVADVTSLVQDWLSGAKPNYGLYVNIGNHSLNLSEIGTDSEPVLFLDVTLPGGLVQFQPGETSKVIPISVINDTTAEPNETIQLTLSNPVNATLGANTVHTYTINDDDMPTVQFGQASSSGAESTTAVSIPVTLSASSSQTVTVDYAVTGGSATGSGTDYTLAAGQLTFTAGVTSQNVPLTINNDTLDENDETIVITLSSPSNATLGANTTHTYTILDDDAAPTVQFSAAYSSGSEATTSVNLAVTISAASGKTVTVNYAATGGTATNGTDYTISGTQVTFSPGVTSQNVPITVVNDATPESNETIIVTLSGPTNATLGTNTTQTYTINDNDSLPAVQFSATSSSGSEATTTANLTVTLSASSSSTVTVDYNVTGGTATQGSDYTLAPGGSQVIALKRDAGLLQGGALASQFTSLTSGNVTTVAVKDARLYDAGDSRYMNFGISPQVPSSSGQSYCIIAYDLSAYAGATINKAQLRLKCTMGNNNMQWAGLKSHDWTEGTKDGNYPGVAPAAAGVTWANPAATNVSNSGPLGWGASSNAMFDPTGNGADIHALTDFVSLPGGNAFVVADVTSLVQDWVSGTKSNYGLLVTTGNHDPYLSESGTDNEPVLFLDVTLPQRSVTFNPGETSKTIPITVVNDSTPESNETIQVTLSNPVNATLGANTVHTYTINDNDTAAAPTFVAAGTVASGTGAITPALPAGLQANDILLLFVETANQTISITNQNGGTWTQVTGSPQGTGTAGGTAATALTAFWSRYNGTQGAPTTSDSGNHQLGRIIAIRGATTSGNPWDVTAGGVEAAADTSGSIAGATTTVANTLVVVAIATSLPDANSTAKFSGWTNADLSSLTERTDNTVTAGNGGGLGIATGGKATAGTYGATAVTLANAAAKGMMSIAIRP